MYSARRTLFSRKLTVKKVQKILQSIESENERQEFIIQRNMGGRTALFSIASADVCEFLLNSITSDTKRDEFVRTEDSQGSTALHWSQNGDIATALMNATKDHQSKLEFILHRDRRGYTAAMGTESHEALQAILDECDDDTVKYLLEQKNERNENLIQRFGMKCCMDHLEVIQDYLYMCDMEETIMAVDNQGNTALVYMVIGHSIACLAETLKLLSLEQRRRAMLLKNKLSIVLRHILLVHPHQLRDQFEQFSRTYQLASYEKWAKHLSLLDGPNTAMAQIAHFMLNEYSLHSNGSMISIRLSKCQQRFTQKSITNDIGTYQLVGKLLMH